MSKGNKGMKLLAILLATMVAICSFPVVYAEETTGENLPENVTAAQEADGSDVTESEPAPEPVNDPDEEPTAEPTEEPTEEPTAEPTAEPTEEPTAEPTAEPTEEPTAEPTQEPFTVEVDPDAKIEEDDNGEEEEDLPDDGADEGETEDDELYEFDDDDQGVVSSELLEQFNNPETFERVEFNGTADIVLKEKTFAYGQRVTLMAKVTSVEMSYRLVWEANDGDERGWYTIGTGMEYSFIVTPEIMNRGYRVVLFAVD